MSRIEGLIIYITEHLDELGEDTLQKLADIIEEDFYIKEYTEYI